MTRHSVKVTLPEILARAAELALADDPEPTYRAFRESHDDVETCLRAWIAVDKPWKALYGSHSSREMTNERYSWALLFLAEHLRRTA